MSLVHLEEHRLRALRFHKAKDLRIEDFAAPGAPGPKDVVLKVTYCGICGTDLHEYTSGPIILPVEPHPFTGASVPIILGHEFSSVEKGVRLIGCWGNDITIGPRLAGLIASGKFPVEKIVTGRVTLDAAVTEGFEELTKKGNDHLKILIRMADVSPADQT
ncbi:alcohol dehydrogenase catalytic domain-containing protein [Rhizobium ruizarguesonis]|uniref:alcohol dehydrogenase catalytic domain-containing protein n=1 Tax=Rhizobium ruizarguesonis TaxID=2081791 RepID=UPI001FE0612A